MIARRIVRYVAGIVVAVVLDLLEAAAYFLAVALLTVLLGLLLPLPVAFAIALVGVSVWKGYRAARRIEQARMRGEHR